MDQLTKAEITFLLATMKEAINKYVPKENRADFVNYLTERVVTDYPKQEDGLLLILSKLRESLRLSLEILNLPSKSMDGKKLVNKRDIKRVRDLSADIVKTVGKILKARKEADNLVTSSQDQALD